MMHYVRVASEKPPLVWLAQLSVQVRKGSNTTQSLVEWLMEAQAKWGKDVFN